MIEAGLRIEVAALTDPGLVREDNEDTYGIQAGAEPARFLLTVADGLGGHRAGEVASKTTVDRFEQLFVSWDGTDPHRFVADATRTANLEVYEAARTDPAQFGMQSTVTAVVFLGNELTAAHIGDCRLYRVRQGLVETLTRDHTLAAEMLRLRILTTEQAVNHPARSQLTRSMGADLLTRPDIIRERVLPGDEYLVCSDGLWSEVTEQEIRESITKAGPAEACERLRQLAYRRGAHDNLTAIVCRVLDVDTSTPAPSRWRFLKRGR